MTKAKRKLYDKKWRKKNKIHLFNYKKQWKRDQGAGYEMRLYYRVKKNNPEKYIFRNVRQTACNKRIPFNIEVSDIFIPKRCPLLGIKLQIADGRVSPNSPSVDRLDSRKGYVKGNIWVISTRANVIKNDATVRELELLVKNLKKRMKKI